MKRSITLLSIIAVAVTLIIAGVAVYGNAGSKMTYKIGIIAPMTGPIAFIGEGMRDAVLLAQEQHKNDKINYEVIIEDDASDPKLSATAANKLTSIDKVDALITLDAPAGNVVNPIATQKDVIHFAITVDPAVLKGDNNFIHWTPPAISSKLLVEEMKKRGIRSIGIFKTISQAGWKYYGDIIEKDAKEHGIDVVTVQGFQDGTKDFRTLIAKAKPKNPDIYVLEMPTPELEVLVKQMREAGINAPLTGIETFEVSEELGLFEGYWYVSATEPMSFYVDSFKKKYGHDPVICSGNTYDIFNLFASAADKLGNSPKPGTAAISKELRKITGLRGAMGALSIDSDGLVQSLAQLKEVKNGKFVPIE